MSCHSCFSDGLVLALQFDLFLLADTKQIPGHQLPPLIYTTALIQVLSFLFLRLEIFSVQLHQNPSIRKHTRKLYARWHLFVLILNAILVFAVVDVIYRPLFYDSSGLSMSRMGYVSHNSAQILVREPDSSKLPLYVSYREHGGDAAWKSVKAVQLLTHETDFTQVFSISEIKTSTYYNYVTSTNHTGTFKTAPTPGEPLANDSKFTFLTSSCIKARFPYNPLSHPRSIPGLRTLAEWIPELHAQFMLFLGDFIYVDVPLRHGFDVHTYRHEYRQVYSSPDWQAVSRNLPWLHVIDDHEIAND